MNRHAEFRASRNGGMRFVSIDLFGQRVQFSFCRCRKSRTKGIRGYVPIAIFCASLIVLHVLASTI